MSIPEAPGYSPNYIKGILDEIALEGLEGITPSDLWLRLNNRPYFPCKPSDEAAKWFLWEAVKRLKFVSFYELPEARPPLVIFDRFEHIDPDLGMIIEPENMPQNIYPHCRVEDPAAGIVGSCATYYTRKDVTELVRGLTYQQVNKRWGHRLVVVGSQAARRRALHNPDVNPNLELTTMQYLVLERVGRSRYHGEITQGQDSLQAVGEDAKSLFYLRKVLHKHRLITKQMFHQKLGAQNSCGLLLHLPRFFVERRPKALTMTEKVVTYLKSKPNFMEEYNILRQNLDLGTSLKKLSKTFNFQKFIKSDVVLHRMMYPDATESEWRYKGANKERSVRVLYLIDSNLDAKDVWQKYDDIYDEEEDDKCGLLDEGHRLLDRTMMAQAYRVLEQHGPEGVTQVELGNSLGASKLASRMLVRNMTKSNKITMFMKDEGRQRTARFALKKFDKCSDEKKQITEEKHKLLKLVNRSSALKKDKNNPLEQPSCSSQMDAVEVQPGMTDHILTALPRREIGEAIQARTVIEVMDTDEGQPTPSVNLVTSEVIGREDGKKKIRKRKLIEPADVDTENMKTEEEESAPKTKKKKKPVSPSKTIPPAADKEVTVIPSEEDFAKEDIEIEITTPDRSLLSKHLTSSRLSPNPSGLEHNSVSFRLLKRTTMVMEAVHKQQVVFDTSKLQKMIYEEEAKEGYDARMDKKSLLRIINKLDLEGLVKHMLVTLRGYGKEKVLTFICHPSVTIEHSVIQSAVDQAKMKFHILGKESVKKKGKQEPKQDNVECLHEAIVSRQEENISNKYSSKVGRLYGFKPKYMRMQVLHKYMFYLIYGYEGDESLDQTQALAVVDSHCKVTDNVRAEMSQVYTPSMDWKMFLPPLPVHSGYTDGWALMSDMLLRLPLSLFIQVVNVMYELPDIEDYLNHPIKKHFLVKNLPLHFRTTLTYARKYIFTIHEQVMRLCCTGLLQMGPQRLKEKDQVFVFLNRRALLWDTTSSRCAYHQITKDREYPVHQYHFHNMGDVEQYWYDLWNFCMHTMLGGRMCMSGELVVVEGLHNKPEMVEALEARAIEEAPIRDVGYLPGDHLGAAGFDSAMFAHLKRNWYWSTTKTHVGSRSTPAPAPTTDLQPVLHVQKKEMRKVASKPPRVISETSSARRRGRRESRPEPKESQRQVKRKLIIKKTVRMLKHRARSTRKPYYDQVDREALLKMSKLRVDWSAKEDNLLLLCKVAFVIFQYIGKRYQNLIVVRQILHEHCPEATDKTSRACQRRLNYIMKNEQTQRSVNLCVEEMKQDNMVMRKLQDLMEVIETEGKTKLNTNQREARWCESYKELVLLLQDRYKKLHSQELSSISEGFILPDTIEELVENYRILRPQKFKRRGFNALNNVMDIHAGIINSTILSSLNCIGDKTSWSYQLFNIYQQYPDKLLRSVMAKTRSDQMVSLRKRYLRTHIRSGDYLPLSSSPYQLSISYINLLLTRYQLELYGDCLAMYRQLAAFNQPEQPHQEVVAAKGGIAACIVEFSTQDQIDFKLDIPDQIIVMDPNVIQKDETYTRIVQRYQDILSKCKDSNQVTMTAIFDEAYNTQSQDSVIDEEMSKPAQNTIAKAATRIALYLTREECDKTMEQKEMQHAHDFFVVNASRVFCRFKSQDNKEDKDPESLIPLSNEVVDSLLSKIKRLAIFPDRSVPNVKDVSSSLGESPQFVEELLEFIRSKKEMGATIEDIREVYGTDGRVARLLSTLVDAQACLRSGVNKTHVVHSEFHRPWVIRSYRLLRSERERLTVPSGHSTYSMLANVGETPIEEHPDKIVESELLTSNTSVIEPTRSVPSISCTSSSISTSSTSSVPSTSSTPSTLSAPSRSSVPSTSFTPSTISAPSSSSVSCTTSAPSTNSVPSINSTSSTTSAPSMRSVKSKSSTPSTISVPSSSSVPCTSSIPSTSSDPSTSSVTSPDCVSSKSSDLPPRQRKAPAHFDDLTLNVYPDSLFKRSSTKLISAAHKKIKKAAPFDPKSKSNLNVCVRPWIRINGSLNRRVLDKFLTSVLGHIMILPLCSLRMVQERFTPAFQPHHTRELVEMLAELNCLKILAVKHSHKPSLFSKPTTISTVPATGLESEEDILLEPDSLAISRLACFIGDTAYQRDIYTT